ncbi:MAG: TldD/PmbA family protein [Candidatus Brocadiia bacterium]
MLGKDEFARIAKSIIAMSKAEETEVMLFSSNSALTRFANNSISQNVSSSDDSISIRVVTAKKTGKAAVNTFDEASLREAVAKAEALMSQSHPDEEYVAMQGKTTVANKAKLFYDATMAFGPMERAAVVTALVKEATKINCEAGGIVSNGGSALGIANSHGLLQYIEGTTADFSATVAAENVSGWAEGHDRDIARINCAELSQKALEGWKASRNPRKIDPGKYDVILPPAAASEFLMFLGWLGFTPVSYHEGTSPLSGKIGQKIFGDNITLVDDFSHPLSLGIPFDFEGTPRTPVTLVEKGVMKGIVYDRRSALKYGGKPTGHALPQPSASGAFPGSMIMTGGHSSIKEMIAQTHRGILVTHLHYTNLVKPSDMTLTGMTRDGVFFVEDGKVAYPVNNMRFTDSIFRILSNVTAISKELEQVEAFFGGSFVVPALKVKDFNFTSSTEF